MIFSRDSLDLDLARSEFDIISKLVNLSSSVKMYCRLVDDISSIVQGEFQDVLGLLKLMADNYPKMPLNVQVSFGYSRFLDLHIYNIDVDEAQNDNYKLCHVLAYKEISSFTYTPCSSNIHDKYKHAVVPISLHRAHTRNSLQQDVDHHLHFMDRIVKSRMQNPVEVRKKIINFFKKKNQHGKKLIPKKVISRNFVSLKFDSGSRRHHFMGSLIRRHFKNRLRILHKSSCNLGSLVCPKRRTIRILSSLSSKIND